MSPRKPGEKSVRKPYNDRVGYRASRRSNVNRGWVVIYDAAAQGLDVAGPYAVVCESHSTMVGDTSMPRARQSMKHPEAWCEECEREMPLRHAVAMEALVRT